MHEDQKPISEYTLEETLDALATALGAFQTDYGSTAKRAQARARKVSLNLDKLLKRYRKVTCGA